MLSARSSINRSKQNKRTTPKKHVESNEAKATRKKIRQNESRKKNTFDEEEFVNKRVKLSPARKKTVVQPLREGMLVITYNDYLRFLQFTEIETEDDLENVSDVSDYDDYDTLYDL